MRRKYIFTYMKPIHLANSIAFRQLSGQNYLRYKSKPFLDVKQLFILLQYNTRQNPGVSTATGMSGINFYKHTIRNMKWIYV